MKQSFKLPGVTMTGTRSPKTEVEVALVFVGRVAFPQSAGAVFKRARLPQECSCWLPKQMVDRMKVLC